LDERRLRLSSTQLMVREAVRNFAQREIAPHARQWATSGAFPPEIFLRLAEQGLMGMLAPSAYGGAEADYVTYALALMEIAAADGALSTVVSVQNAPVIAAILSCGDERQRERFLPALCSGRSVGAFALTEPQAGSDASSLHTIAERAGDGRYRINGLKAFVTSGAIASIALVFAVTEKGAGKAGVSAFIVPTDTPGYAVLRVEKKLGQTASDTCAIGFEDVCVDQDLRLGAEGEGYRIALANLEAGRIGIAAQAVGMGQAALDLAVAYAKERRAFGKAIIEHQAVGFRLAELAARLEAARQLVLHAAALKDAGATCVREASMAKLVASETAEAVCTGALQTLGGYGYIEDYDVARIYRDVRACQIYEGASDIQRMVIARSL
jgi:alkylation response protein AidB-like acyl-CoA dehydrogenase